MNIPDTKMCICGEQECIGGAEVELAGVCHRPNNPCYIIDTNTPDTDFEVSMNIEPLIKKIKKDDIPYKHLAIILWIATGFAFFILGGVLYLLYNIFS